MSTVAQWVRLALTGNPESETPASGTITMLQAGAQQDLIQRFPSCLTGEVLTGADFIEALGYAIAAKIVALPGGGQFAQFVMTVKVQATTETRQNPAQTAAEAQQVLLEASNNALARIECVRKALADETATNPSLVGLSGRRRSSGCGKGLISLRGSC